MTRSRSLITALCLLATSACADWVLVQKATADDKTEEILIRIKDEQTRLDVGKEMSVIAGSADGQMTMLMHPQKMLMRLSADTLKGVMALAGAAFGADQAAAKPVATGMKEKIGEYDCEVFTWSGKMGSGKFWVARDFPGHQALNAAQDKLMKAMGNPASAFAPQAGDFPGMVIKSEMQVMGKSSVSELVSAKEEAVDAAIFVLPTDYQEMKMPGLPGGK
jgi:hypothetical protein